MSDFENLADIRREYGALSLDDEAVAADPLEQFQNWFDDILLIEKHDPTAMVLSTVDKKGFPDSRVVLLKGIDNQDFIFYTNYQSAKAQQLAQTPYAALNFYWPELSRQVRVRGKVEQISAEKSDDYFSSRSLKSQLSAIASPQSQIIKDRAYLENRLKELIDNQGNVPVVRPKNWGGYRLIPNEIEFWQGRDNRLHDRIRYQRQKTIWSHQRLAP